MPFPMCALRVRWHYDYTALSEAWQINKTSPPLSMTYNIRVVPRHFFLSHNGEWYVEVWRDVCQLCRFLPLFKSKHSCRDDFWKSNNGLLIIRSILTLNNSKLLVGQQRELYSGLSPGFKSSLGPALHGNPMRSCCYWYVLMSCEL
jgi:hypothetical protein